LSTNSDNFYTELENDYFKFKPKKIIRALSQNPEDKLFRFLHKILSSPANVITHNVASRSKRNACLNELRRAISDKDLTQKIDKLLLLSTSAERLYDLIKFELDNLPLSRKSVATQCSAILTEAFDESTKLKKEINNHLENLKNNTPFFDLSTASITSSENITFSPDDVITKIVDFISLSFKMLNFKHRLSQGKYITLPQMVTVDDEDLTNARAIFFYSMLWNNLDSAVCSCLHFDGEITVFDESSLPEEILKSEIKEFYEFDRTINPFERFDFISNERLYAKLSQNFNEGIVKFNVHKTVSGIEYLSDLNNGRSITVSEIPSYVALLDTLYLSDHSLLLAGLTLREWVRCYATLEYLANKFEAPRTFKPEELIGYFVSVGISYQKAKTFIDLVTFTSESRDVYDSPLIKMSDGSYYFITVGYFSPGLTNIILSQFSSLKIDLSKKGIGFEREIHSLLSSLNHNYHYFSFKRGDDQYEYDAVMQLDNKVFIFECKNTNLSGGSVAKAKKKFDLFKEAAIQVKRLKYGLMTHPEVFHEQFGLNIDDFEIVPVIVNNLPFSLPGLFDGVYVTDYSALSKILNNPTVGVTKIMNDHGELSSVTTASHRLWENDKLQANDLINQFKNPIQLASLIDNTNVFKYFLQINKDIAFGVCHASTNLETIKTEQQKRLKEYL
jgi:hypothetical protein